MGEEYYREPWIGGSMENDDEYEGIFMMMSMRAFSMTTRLLT